jgi:hypothetical protein
MFDFIGSFGENKDIAKNLRIKKIMPALADDKDIIFDFAQVDGVTQSFIHALISDPIREFPTTVFDKLIFKNCNANVRTVVQIVEEYMQESLDE